MVKDVSRMGRRGKCFGWLLGSFRIVFGAADLGAFFV